MSSPWLRHLLIWPGGLPDSDLQNTTPAGSLGHHAGRKENAHLLADPGPLKHRQHLFAGNLPSHLPLSGRLDLQVPTFVNPLIILSVSLIFCLFLFFKFAAHTRMRSSFLFPWCLAHNRLSDIYWRHMWTSCPLFLINRPHNCSQIHKNY